MRGKEKGSWWRRFVDRCANLFFYKRKTLSRSEPDAFFVVQKKRTSPSVEKKTVQLIISAAAKRKAESFRNRLRGKSSPVLDEGREGQRDKGASWDRHATRLVSPLERHEANPILEPTENAWESKAVFNPAAAYKDGKVHLVYRAIGDKDVSMLGYATSQDGVTIDERSEEPIFSTEDHLRPTLSPEDRKKPLSYDSGGGWSGGCEDPRLIFIDDRVYLLYTAFDGWNSIRIAFTTISLDDFINRRWKWSDRILISPPGRIEKNWVLFPEKINGKFAILRSISPNIHVSYVKDLEDLKDDPVLQKATFKKVSRKGVWDSWVRGAGPPPIKTRYGWLLLYHAMDASDPDRYKLGAMILDEHDPEKILYRSSKPILEPDEIYENRGYKAGVIYSCGAVVIRNELFIYYGGADTVSCVAVANLDHFLNDLVTTGTATLKSAKKTLNESKKKRMYARRKKVSKKSNPLA